VNFGLQDEARYVLSRLREEDAQGRSVVQGISMFLLGAFSCLATSNSDADEVDRAAAFDDAAASMIFAFTATFGATWLTVPWLNPTEIFPLHVRGKGNVWGVVGWSMGNGWLVSAFYLIWKSSSNILF
jgi:hypothetical protein